MILVKIDMHVYTNTTKWRGGGGDPSWAIFIYTHLRFIKLWSDHTNKNKTKHNKSSGTMVSGHND